MRDHCFEESLIDESWAFCLLVICIALGGKFYKTNRDCIKWHLIDQLTGRVFIAVPQNQQQIKSVEVMVW